MAVTMPCARSQPWSRVPGLMSAFSLSLKCDRLVGGCRIWISPLVQLTTSMGGLAAEQRYRRQWVSTLFYVNCIASLHKIGHQSYAVLVEAQHSRGSAHTTHSRLPSVGGTRSRGAQASSCGWWTW